MWSWRQVRRVAAAAALTTVAVGAGGSTVSAGAGSPPATRVDISPFAKEGQNGSVTIHLDATCRRGFVVQELVVSITQAEATFESPVPIDLSCDGRWHRLRIGGPDGFDPGHADVTARLTVLDEETGDPARQAFDEQRVWIEPAAKVSVHAKARLHRDGSASVVTFVRCDQPWIVQELVIDVAQGATGGLAVVSEGIDCDDRWHKVVLHVEPNAGPFTRGRAEVQAFFTVLDPESFDPVSQAQDVQTIVLRGR